MGRGFGRGAKSVAIVTHAQAGTKGKKTPRGLRSVRQKKRERFQKKGDSQTDLEQSLGMDNSSRGKNTPMTLAQEIASIQFPHMVNKRQKGFKQLRRDIIHAAKDVRRRHAEKNKRRLQKEAAREAALAKRESRKKEAEE